MTGISPLNNSIAVRDVLEKGMHIYGVTNAAGYCGAVINMILHGAVNFEHFETDVLDKFDAVKLLTEKSANIRMPKNNKLTILKLMF